MRPIGSLISVAHITGVVTIADAQNIRVLMYSSDSGRFGQELLIALAVFGAIGDRITAAAKEHLATARRRYMSRPVVSNESELGALGVRIVDAIVHENLRYIFRARERRDLGIDGEIELVDEQDNKRRGTGRLIAVQVKCGESFFGEVDDDAFIFRGEPKHLEYWSDFSLPVLVVICHPTTREAYWAEFREGAVSVLKGGWKIRIPMRNLLSTSDYLLEKIARHNYLLDVIDLAVQSWVHATHAERVEFCGILQMPRDYHWYHHLVRVGDGIVMLHWLYARYGRFEAQEVHNVLRYLPGNLSYAPKLMLCFIAESIEPLRLAPDIQALISNESRLETRRLLFRRDAPSLGEVNIDETIDVEYYDGKSVFREDASGNLIGQTNSHRGA